MQASANIAASLNPAVAIQGAATNGAQAAGKKGAGIVDLGATGDEDKATDDKAGLEGFADALGAALTAALGAPVPVQPIRAAPAEAAGEAATPTAGLTSPTPSFAPVIVADTALTATSAAAEPGSALATAFQGLIQTAQASAPAAPDVKPELLASATPAAPAPTQELTAPIAPPVQTMPEPVEAAPAAAAVEVVATAVAQTTAAQTVAAQAPVPKPTAPSETRTSQADGSAKTGKGKTAQTGETRTDARSTLASAADAEKAAAQPATEASADHSLEEQAEKAPIDRQAAAQTQAIAPGAASELQGAAPLASTDTPRATSHTVAHLAAQIANNIDGKTTRFDVQLDPHGLGKVDVRVAIGADGQISAALSFDNPQSAAELRGKAGELQSALEQAGFDMSKTSLSFSSGGGENQQSLLNQQQQQQGQGSGAIWRGRAFTDLSDTNLEAALAPVQRRAAAGGVDVRI